MGGFIDLGFDLKACCSWQSVFLPWRFNRAPGRQN
jgi:hypothetical protein